MCYLINNSSLSGKRENTSKTKGVYSNENRQQLDIPVKLEQQIHIKFSKGILHKVVCYGEITLVFKS